MKIINRSRRSGKTMMLVMCSYVTKIPIVVHNMGLKYNVLNVAKSMKCKVDVYTISEWNKICTHKSNKVLIDECSNIIEDALQSYLGCEIVACTTTIPMDDCREDE